MTFEEEKKVRDIIRNGLKKNFTLKETDLIAPNANAWDKVKDNFKSVISGLLTNLEKDDYDDASGDIDKAISMLKSWKKKIEKDINDSSIKEDVNSFFAENTIKHYLGDNFIKYLIPNSCRTTYGPDKDGTYSIECRLQIPKKYFPDLETATLETMKQLAFNDYRGPGESYSEGTVYAINSNELYYNIGFDVSGGYDI